VEVAEVVAEEVVGVGAEARMSISLSTYISNVCFICIVYLSRLYLSYRNLCNFPKSSFTVIGRTSSRSGLVGLFAGNKSQMNAKPHSEPNRLSSLEVSSSPAYSRLDGQVLASDRCVRCFP